MMLRFLLYFTFIVSFGGFYSLYAQNFSWVDPGFPVCHYPAAAWVDVDNDGDLDAFFTGLDETASPVANLFRNDGNGVFTPLSISVSGVYSASCAFGDINNDGLADLAVSGTNGTTATTIIYRNDGGGVFTDIGAGITGLYDGSLAWGDYNNDGLTDLLVSGLDNAQSPLTLLYINEGGLTFTESGLTFTGLSGSSIAWSDLDLDLDLDFVIVGQDDAQAPHTIIYLNDNGFFNEMGAGLTALKDATAAWGDYNNDTYPDLLLSGSDASGTPQTLVYSNLAGIAFSSLTGTFNGILNGSAIWGDFTNDGDLDFLISGRYLLAGGGPPMPGKPASLELYINLDNDQFLMEKILLPGVEFNAIVCGDYDNDSDLDLLVTGKISNSISVTNDQAVIYRNEISAVNNPPDAPTDLVYEIIGNEILFQWDASTDDKTPSSGLNYNIRVGTQSGNVDIYSPLADLNSGYRKIVGTGNTGSNISWSLAGQEFGSYHASVQAIDHNYAGSAFSSTISVFISPTATFTIADSLCLFDQTTVTYTGNASPAAQYIWDFDGAVVVSGSGQGPYIIYWGTEGLKIVSLTVIENEVASEPYSREVHVIGLPGTPGFIAGPPDICQGTVSTEFIVPPIPGAETYDWHLNPPGAGMISGSGIIAEVVWEPAFSGNAFVFVRAENYCGYGPYSDSLTVMVSPLPGSPGKPVGPDQLCQNPPNTDYIATAAPFGLGYQWHLLPGSAGVVFNNGLEAEIDWDNSFTGEAKIFVTSFNDCGSGAPSDTLSIWIHVPPVADAGDDQVIPFGTSTQLFGSASGGSGSYEYFWTPAEFLVNPGTSDPTTLNLEQSVQFILMVTDEESGCPAYDQMIVTVAGGPLNLSVSADPEFICSGEETQLLALAGGGSGNYTYNWSSNPPGFSSDIADPIATPLETTKYYAEVSDGAEPLIDSVLIEVFPLPGNAGEIDGPTEVCSGSEQIVYIIEPVANASHYLWSLSEGLYGSSDSTSILVNFSLFASNAIISVTPANDCGMGMSGSLDIDILYEPDVPQTPVGPDTICTTTDTLSTYILNASVPGATAYEWMLLPEESGIIQGNGLSADVHWVKNWEGDALIGVRAMNQCGYSAWAEPFAVNTFNSLGVEDYESAAASLMIYPNPSKGVLNVDFYVPDKPDKHTIHIWDVFGRKLLDSIINGSRGMIRFDISFLPEGIYILTLSDQNRLLANVKFVVNK